MAKGYTPRRAGLTRWLEGAPDYILDCFDNDKTADRYTVLFTGPDFLVWAGDGQHTFRNCHVPYLGMSDAPSHPQGFSQWGELTAHQTMCYRFREGKRRVRWLDLPQHIRAHVIARTALEVPVSER